MLDALIAVCGLWCTYVDCNTPLYANAFTAMLSARGTTGRLTTRSEILLRSAQNYNVAKHRKGTSSEEIVVPTLPFTAQGLLDTLSCNESHRVRETERDGRKTNINASEGLGFFSK
jgi:hypothetical protein